MACEKDSSPTVVYRAREVPPLARWWHATHLEIGNVLVVLVQRLGENQEHETRRFQEFGGSSVLARFLGEGRVDGRQHAHEHKETVHLSKDVLRARVLEHDFVDLRQDLFARHAGEAC